MRGDVERPTQGLDLISRREAVMRVLGLLGGTFSAPTVAALLAACEGREPSARPGGAARGAGETALSPEQSAMVATVAEHIIPQTDTPGARAVGVPAFITAMVSKYYPPEDRKVFLAGLADLDRRAQQAHQHRFSDCTPEQQVALLTALDRETAQQTPAPTPPSPTQLRERVEPGTGGTPLPPEVSRDTARDSNRGTSRDTTRDTARNATPDTTHWHLETPGPRRLESPQVPFWRMLKELTLVGYYTSKPGATEELRHEPVPGHYEACVPLAQIGRAWAV
jgi:hypothetical protein